ncbi:hypothetical protein K2X30_02980 [bacterium]|jgi:hypothetical protein|nr:hypothetical protein [bacterium]
MNVARVLLAVLLVQSFALPAVYAGDKPYKRAIVFAGNNLDTAEFLGIYDAAVDEGKAPDLIVASCGGSLAAMIIKAFPNRDERNAFMKSPTGYALYKTLANGNDLGVRDFISRKFYEIDSFSRRNQNFFNNKNENTNAATLERTLEAEGQQITYHQPWSRTVPNLFSKTAIDIAQDISPAGARNRLNQRFTEGKGGSDVSVVILGSRSHFGPQDIGKEVQANSPLFSEVHFTDEKTARYLKGSRAFAPSQFSGTAVADQVEVVTDATLAEAARASVSDPWLVAPLKKDGQYYFTGATNINPNNVAKKLASQVIGNYSTAFDDFLAQNVLYAAFGFDGNAVLKRQFVVPTTYSVDMTDKNSRGFPQVSPQWWKNKNLEVKMGPPSTLSEFKEIFDVQYAAGKRLAKEALLQGPYYRGHIKKRELDNGNNSVTDTDEQATQFEEKYPNLYRDDAHVPVEALQVGTPR